MTTTLSAAEAAAADALIGLAFAEDLGERGDITTLATVPAESAGSARFVVRKPGVVAGLGVVARAATFVTPAPRFRPLAGDGDWVAPGTAVAEVAGPVRSILTAERTMLNFLQRLSGVATLTRQFVDAVNGLPAAVLDTRKTAPGWRLLEKLAVRAGGGTNHRAGLHDAALIKDNHLAAMAGVARPVAAAVAAARAAAPDVRVTVEVDTLGQLDEALPARPDVVLLDNMTNDQLREAVRRRDAAGPGVLLEASGGVNLETIRGIAETGVDRISVGALTHSAAALDIGLDYGEGT